MMFLPQKMDAVSSHKDFQTLIPVYFTEDVIGVSSQQTVLAKTHDLKLFLKYLKARDGILIPVDQWLPMDTRIFLDDLSRQGYVPATINRVLATIRAFANWLVDHHIIRMNPVNDKLDVIYWGMYEVPQDSIFSPKEVVLPYFSNSLYVGENFGKSSSIGFLGNIKYFPGSLPNGDTIELADPAIRLADREFINTPHFRVHSDLRYYIPVSSFSRNNGILSSFESFHMSRYLFPASKFSIVSYFSIRYNILTSQSKANEKFFITIHRPILCELLLKHARHPRLRELILVVYRGDARITAQKSGNLGNMGLIKSGRSWFQQSPDEGIRRRRETGRFLS
jgi:hypothetical protein